MALDHIEHYGVPADSGYISELALKVGQDNNLLLLEQAVAVISGRNDEVPDDLEQAKKLLEQQWYDRRLLRWLETPVRNEQGMSEQEIAEARYAQTLRQADNVRNGQGFVTYVTATARNEAKKDSDGKSRIDRYFEALKQPSEYPIVGVVGAIDGSDGGAGDILRHGGNVTYTTTRGIASGRQRCFDHIRHDEGVIRTALESDQEIFLVTDLDTLVLGGLINAYGQTFDMNRNLQVASSPVLYPIVWKDRPYIDGNGNVYVPGDTQGSYAGVFTPRDVAFINQYCDQNDSTNITIRDFASYQFFTGVSRLEDYVNSWGYDKGDISLGSRLHMFPGPNTAVLGSGLDLLDSSAHLTHATDFRQEMYDWSLKVQSCINPDQAAANIGRYNPDVGVIASGRGITAEIDQDSDREPCTLTTRHLLEQRQQGGPYPYKSKAGSRAITARDSVRLAIRDIQRGHNLYDLGEDEVVVGYFASKDEAEGYASNQPGLGECRYADAIQPTTRKRLGKIALIVRERA